ncbi:MAG: hypothetical protein ABI415_11720 [Flavitalea sp.]
MHLPNYFAKQFYYLLFCFVIISKKGAVRVDVKINWQKGKKYKRPVYSIVNLKQLLLLKDLHWCQNRVTKQIWMWKNLWVVQIWMNIMRWNNENSASVSVDH